MFPLKISSVEINIKEKRLLGPINLLLQQKGISVVLGANGSGKTTLLESIHGLRNLSKGEINWSIPNNLAAKKQSFVFQTPIMLRRSVLENLMYPLRVRKFSKTYANKEAKLWIKKIGLEKKINQQATLLSGGEMQAVAVARALITKPKMLFLDEPTASLDGLAKKTIEDILVLAAKNDTKIIMSTHDLGQAKRLADDIIYLHKGLMESHCLKDEFLNSPPSDAAKQFIAGDIII